MEIEKDGNGEATGTIKIDCYEAHDLYRAVKYVKTHCLSDRDDYWYDPETGEFDATGMKEFNELENQSNARLIRQLEFVNYSLAPFKVLKDNYKRLGQTGSEN
tara:strand:+ start:192 stop:500 length:309 start_codon:yes stop_codon:yes gene_type:complete